MYVVPQPFQMALTEHERLSNIPATSYRHHRINRFPWYRKNGKTGVQVHPYDTANTRVVMATTAPAFVGTTRPLLGSSITGIRCITNITDITLIICVTYVITVTLVIRVTPCITNRWNGVNRWLWFRNGNWLRFVGQIEKVAFRSPLNRDG